MHNPKGGTHALGRLEATHVQAHQRRTPTHPMPNVPLWKEPTTRMLSVYARRSCVWTAFWSFDLCAKCVGCRLFVRFAHLLTPCFHCGSVRRARPEKVGSIYVTSLAASQKLKLSLSEALAVGTKSEAPALSHGRVVACHSLVAQISKRGATVRLHDPAFFFVSCKPAGMIRVTGPPS